MKLQEENVEEVWKDVVGYKNIYKVSNLGRVKRLAKSFIRKDGKPFTLKEKVLTPNPIKGGYYQYKLTKNGKEKSLLRHRLVCRAFHGPAPKGKNFVNHKDTDKENNRADNLEWCSFQENMNHAALHGLRPRGSGHFKHRLSENDVVKICELLDSTDLRQEDIAQAYGVNSRTISCIDTGISWNWLTNRKETYRRRRRICKPT